MLQPVQDPVFPLRPQETIRHSPSKLGQVIIDVAEDGSGGSPSERLVPYNDAPIDSNVEGDDSAQRPGNMLTNVRRWVQSRLDHNEGQEDAPPEGARADPAPTSPDQDQDIFKFGESKNEGQPFTFSAPVPLMKELGTGQDNLPDIPEEEGF